MGEMLVFVVAGAVVSAVGIFIKVSLRCAGARKLLKQAEAASAQGDWSAADGLYRKLIVAVAGNKEEVPMWLARLEEAGRKSGRAVDSAGVLQANQAIVDIWASKMPDGEKRKLHQRALTGLKAKLGE